MPFWTSAGSNSPYPGVAAVMAGLGVQLDPGLWQNLVAVATALAGLAAYLIRDR